MDLRGTKERNGIITVVGTCIVDEESIRKEEQNSIEAQMTVMSHSFSTE
jgi:hypothetical protein